MNYGRAFSFVQEDPEWLKKVAIAMLIMLIPIVGQITVGGWALEVMRRVIKDEPEILPEWSEFSTYLMLGLKELVVGLVYVLPALILYCCGLGVTLALVGVTGGAAESSGSGSDAAGIMSGITALSYGCNYCVFILLLILAMLMLPPATALFVESGELGAAFRFREVIATLRAALGPFVISTLIILLIAPFASSLGAIACGIGSLFALSYMRLVSVHLFGQAYKIAKANQVTP